jgi:heat shock protein HslJ
MLCPHNEALENKLVQILAKTTHYDIDYDMLMLMCNGEILAVFKAQAQEK